MAQAIPRAKGVASLALDTSGLKYGPVVVGALAFAILFWAPFTTLLRDWWSDPEAGHGLLLGPVAVYLAWKRGLEPEARPRPYFGLAVLIIAVFLRYLSSLAAELFTMRFSMLLAVVGLLLFAYGVKQLVRWWLPLTLIALSIPLPSVVLGSLALPLQFKASQMGAAMLEARHVPVLLQGNVIRLPGRSLFVTEACSGLRSLTSLIALGVLIAGMWLRKPSLRLLLVLLTIPIAVVLNGVRVFLTGFLVVFVDPRLGDGLMHLTEGWGMFVIAFAILGGFAWVLYRLEHLKLRKAAA
jgi:exosortase